MCLFSLLLVPSWRKKSKKKKKSILPLGSSTVWYWALILKEKEFLKHVFVGNVLNFKILNVNTNLVPRLIHLPSENTTEYLISKTHSWIVS